MFKLFFIFEIQKLISALLMAHAQTQLYVMVRGEDMDWYSIRYLVHCYFLLSGQLRGFFRRSKCEDLDLPIFDFSTTVSATNNFSLDNKLGQGGFGAVYKVTIAFIWLSIWKWNAKLVKEAYFYLPTAQTFECGNWLKTYKNLTSFRVLWEMGRKLLSRGCPKVLGKDCLNSRAKPCT